VKRLLVYKPAAQRELANMDRSGATHMIHALEAFAADGRDDVKALKGVLKGWYRLRIGKWHASFSLDQPGNVVVTDVAAKLTDSAEHPESRRHCGMFLTPGRCLGSNKPFTDKGVSLPAQTDTHKSSTRRRYAQMDHSRPATNSSSSGVISRRVPSGKTDRPVGRPGQNQVVWHKGFLYQARFYNKRGTTEQWIKEGKQAVKMTRLSCHRFRSNEGRTSRSLTLRAG
jgi:hypothetical protein